MLSNENSVFLADNAFKVIFTNFVQKIHEKSENDQFQWKWVYRIKHVKCYRMKSISPVRLWILSDLNHFNPKIHEKSENDQFQWTWVYRIKHVKCYRMKSISPFRLWIIIALSYFDLKIHEKLKMINFNESGFIGLSTSNAIEWNR